MITVINQKQLLKELKFIWVWSLNGLSAILIQYPKIKIVANRVKIYKKEGLEIILHFKAKKVVAKELFN